MQCICDGSSDLEGLLTRGPLSLLCHSCVADEHSLNVCLMLSQRCSYLGVGREGVGGRDPLTLIKPGGRLAPHTTASRPPPGFKMLSSPLLALVFHQKITGIMRSTYIRCIF